MPPPDLLRNLLHSWHHLVSRKTGTPNSPNLVKSVYVFASPSENDLLSSYIIFIYKYDVILYITGQWKLSL